MNSYKVWLSWIKRLQLLVREFWCSPQVYSRGLISIRPFFDETGPQFVPQLLLGTETDNYLKNKKKIQYLTIDIKI